MTISSSLPHSPTRFPPLSPLALPEILQLIFSYLSQHHLLTSVSQVCKTWHTVAASQTMVTARWHESMGEAHQRQLFSERFSRARVLHCTFGQYSAPSNEIGLQARNHLGACLASLEPTTTDRVAVREEMLSTKWVGCDPTRFKSLILEGIYDNKSFGFQQFKTLAPSITRLDIRNWELLTFPLDTFLGLFTQLESLSIMHRIHTDYGHQGSVLTWQGGPPSKDNPVPRLAMKSLALTGFRCDLTLLYALLGACPDLIDLKLATFCGILQGQQYSYSSALPIQYPAMRDILEKISRLCPKIQSLHLSERGHWMPAGVLKMMVNIWPDLKSFSLPVNSLFASSTTTVAPLMQLSPQMNHLTTLELTTSGTEMQGYDQKAGKTLHHFLCSSPSLKHLKARAVPYHIHRIFEKGTQNPVTSFWACRNLETLEFRFTLIMYETEAAMIRKAQMDSRAFFAFLVKMCPKLKGIWLGKSELRLDLEGGLCLLTELKDLEKLVIFSTSQAELDWRDLEWLSTRKERTLPSDPAATSVVEKVGWSGVWPTGATVLGLRVGALRDWVDISKWRSSGTTTNSAVTPTASTTSNGAAVGSQPEELESAQAEKQLRVLLKQGLTEQIERARTLGGVAETIERLAATTASEAGEKRCWPMLEVLWLRSEVPLSKRKRVLEMVECLRPDLRYQAKPAPLEKSG